VAAIVLAASFASAQSQASVNDPKAAANPASNESSSLAFSNESVITMFSADATEPSPGGGAGGHGAAGQEYGGGGGWKHYVGSRFAFEAGGGLSAPISSAITYGGQFTVGGGLNFTKHLGALIEYQFMDNKLPGALIAETGANGGHAHIWSFTIDPVVDLFPKSTNGIYITGGGGFYRKVTDFTDPVESEYCDFYYGCGYYTSNQVVGHFSSNQGGFNVGGGFQRRMGGIYGDGRTKLFVEARFVDVLTPAVIGVSPNGLGTITSVAADTKAIPVSVGVRF
jgi:hypothetical protein